MSQLILSQTIVQVSEWHSFSLGSFLWICIIVIFFSLARMTLPSFSWVFSTLHFHVETAVRQISFNYSLILMDAMCVMWKNVRVCARRYLARQFVNISTFPLMIFFSALLIWIFQSRFMTCLSPCCLLPSLHILFGAAPRRFIRNYVVTFWILISR